MKLTLSGGVHLLQPFPKTFA